MVKFIEGGPSNEPPDVEGWGEHYETLCGYCQHPGKWHDYDGHYLYTGAGHCLVEGCVDIYRLPCKGFSQYSTERILKLNRECKAAATALCSEYEEKHKTKWFW